MLSRTLAVVVAVFAIPTNVAGLYKGVAEINPTPAAGDRVISGILYFEHQMGNDGNMYMQVSGTVSGLPDGIHGFHIHQYGDESLTTQGKNRYGAHFVPTCQTLPDPSCTPLAPCEPKPDPCKLAEIHGLPPDEARQAGDMGNIEVRGGEVTLPGGLIEVKTGFGQDKMDLDSEDSSILGRAVAIHKYADIGRDIPLYDNLCASTCNVDPALPATEEANYPDRACSSAMGQAKIEDIRVEEYSLGASTYSEISFANINENTQNLVARYISLSTDVWYRVKRVVRKPDAETDFFSLEFDNANACNRRVSANFLKTGSQFPDAFGAAGPAIAGGIVGRMNPNLASDGKTSTSVADETKPARGTSQISCYLRATSDAGANSIGGEALIVQKLGTKEVDVQAKLKHGLSMSGTYSFHFHDYGDLRPLDPPQGDMRRVGHIYKEGQSDDILALKTLEIPTGQQETYILEKYTLPDGISGVDEYVGRSLTIHSGPTKESPTVSYGVCGIGNPDSIEFFHTTTELKMKPKEEVANNAVTLGLSVASVLALFFW